MVTKRLDLKNVKVERVPIHDGGQFGSDHYEDVVPLSEVRAIIADANCMLAERDGIIDGLKMALNATYGVGSTEGIKQDN